MKFVILSKTKIDAVESNLSDFIAEDLLEAISSKGSLIVTANSEEEFVSSLEQLTKLIETDNTSFKYKYEVSIERKS